MALWQVDFAIVPRRALVAAPRVPLAQVLDADWWSDAHLPSGYSQQLNAIAAAGSSATTDRQTWGTEDGNRIDVWFEKGRAVRMIARVDVRRLDAKFGAMLLQFAQLADAMLVRKDGLVVEPLAGPFGAALRTSAAWRFVADPAVYLESLERVDDDE